MNSRLFAAGLLAALALRMGAQAPAASLADSAQRQLPALTEVYKHLHANPELSRHEERTSAYLAAELRKLGYTVTEHVGRYEDGAPGFGIVAVLENGPGPRLLIRTDMDALPVEEKTGLEFASRVKVNGLGGQQVGVMHACGHDLHMTVLLGTARELAQRKAEWHGSVMLVGQPAEEVVQGARAMLDDKLYERFGKPDFVLAEHDSNDVAAGAIALKAGPLMASSTTLNVTVRGIGGHGSRPESGKDPIVLAAEFVLAVQTIVSRQIDPQQPAVLTVGTIHGGTKSNIIPDEVTMGMTLRTFSMPQRDEIVADVRRTAEGLATAYGIPADLMPTVSVAEGTPVTANDPELTERLRAAARKALGVQNVVEARPVMGSEDFGQFALGGQIPGMMYWLGAADPEKLKESQRTRKPLPTLHSALFAPVYATAIPTGVTAMTAMALELLH
ncbi:MAG: amidohydrolase [Terracidiphilus sp.]